MELLARSNLLLLQLYSIPAAVPYAISPIACGLIAVYYGSQMLEAVMVPCSRFGGDGKPEHERAHRNNR